MRKSFINLGIVFMLLVTSCTTKVIKLNGESFDKIMNKWHNDVATFNLIDYFEFMADDFIFLGTAPEERWTKQEFFEFSEPFFLKKKTWDFKTNWRNWYQSEDGKTVWFEESLDTWMEECRGSGVLVLTNNGWKIKHYNLTVLIENEKMNAFLDIRKSD